MVKIGVPVRSWASRYKIGLSTPAPSTHLQGKGQASLPRPRTLSGDSLAAGPGRELLRVRRVGEAPPGRSARLVPGPRVPPH